MKHVSEQKVNKFIELVNKEYKLNGESDTYFECIKTCYKTQNIPFMIEFCARVKGVNSAAFFGKFIAENGTPEQNLIFAQRAKNADKQLHIDVVAKSENPELCLEAAKTLSGVDTYECGKVVLEKGAYFTNYLYARDVKDIVDCKPYQDVVLQSDNANLIYAFAMDCSADLYVCFNKLLELKASQEQCYNVYSKMTAFDKLKVQLDELQRNFKQGKTHITALKKEAICYYATEIYNSCGRNSTIEECEKICLETNNASLLNQMAKTNAFDYLTLGEKIAECGNGVENYEFMMTVIEKEKLIPYEVDAILYKNNQRVLKYGDAYASYLVAKDIHPENVFDHEKLVIKSKDALLNTLYAKNVKNAIIDYHQAVVMKNGTIDDVVKFIKQVKGADLANAYVSLKDKNANEMILKAVETKLTNNQKISIMIDELNSIETEIDKTK